MPFSFQTLQTLQCWGRGDPPLCEPCPVHVLPPLHRAHKRQYHVCTHLLQPPYEPLVLHPLVRGHGGPEHAVLGHHPHVVLPLVLPLPVLCPHPLLLGPSEHLAAEHRHGYRCEGSLRGGQSHMRCSHG